MSENITLKSTFTRLMPIRSDTHVIAVVPGSGQAQASFHRVSATCTARSRNEWPSRPASMPLHTLAARRFVAWSSGGGAAPMQRLLVKSGTRRARPSRYRHGRGGSKTAVAGRISPLAASECGRGFDENSTGPGAGSRRRILHSDHATQTTSPLASWWGQRLIRESGSASQT